MLQEFKNFIMKGNVVDLAVGVIIGGAFGKIVSSLVDDIIMPPLGFILGNVDFSDLFIDLSGKGAATLAAAKAAGSVTINYGLFVNNIINLLIVGFAIFMIVKGLNNLQKPKVEEAAAPAEPSEDVKLLTEIRDLLKK